MLLYNYAHACLQGLPFPRSGLAKSFTWNIELAVVIMHICLACSSVYALYHNVSRQQNVEQGMAFELPQCLMAIFAHRSSITIHAQCS